MTDKLNQQELRVALNKVANDQKNHRISTGVFARRYADNTVKFLALVDVRTKEESLREWFTDYDSAVKAYDDFIVKHGIKSRKFQDLTGKKFGHLKVLERAKTRKGNSYWKCECDLDGNIIEVEMGALIKGKQTRCGAHKNGSVLTNYSKQQTKKYKGTNPDTFTRRKPTTNTSGVKGVSTVKTKYGVRYLATLEIRGERHFGHLVKTVKEAANERHQLEAKYQQPILDQIKQDKQSD